MSYADATTVTIGILLAGNMMGHDGALLVHDDWIHTDCIYRNGDTIVDQRMGLSNDEKTGEGHRWDISGYGYPYSW